MERKFWQLAWLFPLVSIWQKPERGGYRGVPETKMLEQQVKAFAQVPVGVPPPLLLALASLPTTLPLDELPLLDEPLPDAFDEPPLDEPPPLPDPGSTQSVVIAPVAVVCSTQVCPAAHRFGASVHVPPFGERPPSPPVGRSVMPTMTLHPSSHPSQSVAPTPSALRFIRTSLESSSPPLARPRWAPLAPSPPMAP